jgi:hypothetical protein
MVKCGVAVAMICVALAVSSTAGWGSALVTLHIGDEVPKVLLLAGLKRFPVPVKAGNCGPLWVAVWPYYTKARYGGNPQDASAFVVADSEGTIRGLAIFDEANLQQWTQIAVVKGGRVIRLYDHEVSVCQVVEDSLNAPVPESPSRSL